MSTFGGILSIARTAINAHQAAIQVTSHNVANAETPGYTRQRAVLEPAVGQRTPIGVLGRGVVVRDVAQLRDSLLDASFRRESSQASGSGLRRDLLGQLEGVLAEPTENGFGATLDAFWNAWADLANTPGNPTAREVVRQRGEQVAFALNGYARRLGELTDDTAARLGNSVTQLNEYTRQVAELNVQIVASEVGGRTAGDLRDARNSVIDSIARLADVQVHARQDGSVAVVLAGQSLVDGSRHKALEYGGSVPAVRLTFAGSGEALPPLGGEMGAMLEVLNADIPAARGRLDELAAGIVSTVNAAHRAGWSPAQDTNPVEPPGWNGSGIDFFDPNNVDAATISISVAVRGNRDMVAAGDVYGGAGDNAVARAMARLRDTEQSWGSPAVTAVLGAHFRDTVSGIAMSTNAATSSAAVFETLAANTDARRQSVAGVSTDEELIALMRHQQAYTAATRLVSVVDEMAQALLNMV